MHAQAARGLRDVAVALLVDPLNVFPPHAVGGHRLLGRGRQGAWEDLVTQEWLVTNGMGGYACGTASGVPTRRFHGLLVAALPSPHGRTMMFNHLWEEIVLPGGRKASLTGQEHEADASAAAASRHLLEFRLSSGITPPATFVRRLLSAICRRS